MAETTTDAGKDVANATWLGTSYKTIHDAGKGGAMSIVDSTSPAGSGPPRHVHKAEDETFVVLTGEIVFWVAGQSRTVPVGATVTIPKGTEHTFRVSDAGPSRHLIILTPGGFEGFFEEMKRLQCRIPEDMKDVVEIGARYNLEITGPPLEA